MASTRPFSGEFMGFEMTQKAEREDENEVADEIEVQQEPELENVGDEQNSDADQETQAEAQEESGDEVIVSIGEETPPQEQEQRAPEWVRELRKSHRELQRQNRELQAKLETTQTETKPAVLGAKPTLEAHDYDAEKYEAALADWFERKRQVDEQAQQAKKAEEVKQQEWQAKLDAYGKAKAGLRVKDFDDAEMAIQEVFNVTQQGVVLQGAENPALVVYALGKNPKRAKELADIKDPVKFAFAVAKLETQLKVTNRKAAPPPERSVKGTGSLSGAVDSTLERLREEAAKTGNMSKVMAYKRQLRQKSN
jgi:hypothetical protein